MLRTTRWLLVLPALAGGGCWSGKGEFSIRELLFGPSGPKLVEMVIDENNADRRREGIVRLCEQPWGLRDPYLKYFSLRLRMDPEPSVRSVSARALGRAGDPKYLPNLILALRDKNATVRWDVAVALQHVLGDDAVAPLLVTAAEDPSPDVRAAAIVALRNYHRPEVVRALVRCLGDDVFGVRYSAHESLVTMLGTDLGYEPEQWAPILAADLPPPTSRWRRPWWDWFGVTEDWPRYHRPPEQPTGPRRPWWDWSGRSRPTEPSDGAATQPAEARRPWWDWLGLSGRGRQQPAPEPAVAPAPPGQSPASQPAGGGG